MEKKYEDDELDQLINEQFIREAEIMKEAIFSGDEDMEDYEASDEEIKASCRKLMQRLKKEGACREDVEDENAVDVRWESDTEDGTGHDDASIGSTVVPIKKKRINTRKIAKVAGIIVVSGMCVCAASMTCDANRDYFVKHAKYLLGNDTGMIFDNDETNEPPVVYEHEVREGIETQLGICSRA